MAHLALRRLSLREETTTEQRAKISENESHLKKRLRQRVDRCSGVAWSSRVAVTRREDGRKIVNDYVCHEEVGRGSFSKVRRCSKLHSKASDHTFAIKIYNMKRLRRMKTYLTDSRGRMRANAASEKVLQELLLMATLRHDNVVPLYEIIMDDDRDKIYAIFKYFSLGQSMTCDVDTLRFTKRGTDGYFGEAEAKRIFRGLARGLEYLHENGIAHRDIKVPNNDAKWEEPHLSQNLNCQISQPENVLLDLNGECAIADLNTAHEFTEDELDGGAILYGTQGTYFFLSPEECEGGPFNAFAADIWSMGVSLYCFIFGALPFTAIAPGPLLSAIRECEISYPSTPALSSDLKDLFSRVLVKDPTHRFSLTEILQHDWLAE